MRLFYKILPFFYLFLLSTFCFSQSISLGPIIGAMKSDGFSMYVRSTDASNVELKLSANQSFSQSSSFSGLINVNKDSSVVISVTGLQPNTLYYYRVYLDNSLSYTSSVKTFNLDGSRDDLVFGVGSCVFPSYSSHVLNSFNLHSPSFFIYTGDWTYPDYSYGTSSNLYPSMPGKIESSYHDRYSDTNVANLFSTIPVDYVYDDHDFIKDNCSGSSYSNSSYNSITNTTNFLETTYPDSLKSKVVAAYMDYFPHYNLPDTSSGIYHSFMVGNSEFFVLDLRYNRTSNTNCFTLDPVSGEWSYTPDSTHTILGDSQKSWLSNELLNSTADWKFIISSVTYNKSLQLIMDLMIYFQNNTFTYNNNVVSAAYMASILADSWAGYKLDRDWLYDYCQQNSIDNVIVLSGDTHTSAIDDGENAGFPEMMAANLAQQNSRLAYYLDSIYYKPLFNAGGQGIFNNNFNFTFGKVEVFKEDSCRLSIIDEYNDLICSHTVLSSIYNSVEKKDAFSQFKIFPIPAVNEINITANNSTKVDVNLYDVKGQLVLVKKNVDPTHIILNVKDLKNGIYNLEIKNMELSKYFARTIIVLH